MFGPGFAPTPPRRPHTAVLILLRVLFVALTVLSFGFLSWAAMLRIAVVRKRPVDWVLFCATVVVAFGALMYIGTGQTEEPRSSDMALLVVLVLMAVGITTYFLVFDIRHFSRERRAAAVAYGPSPTSSTPVPQPYGYGYPPPYAVPAQPRPHPQPNPQPHPQPRIRPQSAPSQTPPRIDQVRAELDELSDILRKGQEGQEGREGRNDR
ncbi:hypothetical protein AB0O64_06735 [Streptomyces sp. NPDC088341]|uniref:hypothetical protein n=1 Tax=Streptomyces sp. NPDC088341 TaxID=3154870 RepID=UPI00343DC2EE